MKILRKSLLSAFLAALFLAAMFWPSPGYGEPATLVFSPAAAYAFDPTASLASSPSASLTSGLTAAQAGEDFGDANGGSSLVGAPATSNTWYFAAGCAGDDRNAVISIDNPGGSQADVSVVFYTRMGEIQGPEFSVSPHRSASIDVSQYLTEDEVGAKVSSSQPVLARRTIYSEGRIETNPGATSLSTKYLFAEGYVGSGFAEEICVINPGDADATLTLEYHSPTGTVISKNHQVKSKHRATISVNDDLKDTGFNDVFLVLTSPRPVFAERVMNLTYLDFPSMHISPGATATAGDWYFPPVSAAKGFNAWLVNMNIEGDISDLHVDFLLDGGANASADFSVPPDARLTLNVNAYVPEGRKAALRVHAAKPLACELASYFDYDSPHLGGACKGGACLPGATALGKKFFLPGGAVGNTHEQWVNLANFGGSAATVTVKAYTSGGTVTKGYDLPAGRCRVVSANQDILSDGEIYAYEVSSGSDFLAGKSDFYASEEAPLPPGAEYAWYFAEGCTREGFSEWLCLQNPGEADIEVHAVYMLFGAEPREEVYPVPARSRSSINVEGAVGPGQDVSVMLWSGDEFYAERPMYFSYKQGQPGYSWDGGHVTFGVTSPRREWYFAEGCTREGFEEWLCIQNPNDGPAQVYIDYILAGAPTQQKSYPVPARSRFSVNVNADVAAGQDVSAYVHSDLPIVCERPMYFNYGAVYNPGRWPGGHVVMGAASPGREWYFAEGCTRAGFEEWICIQNPNPAEAHLHVAYATCSGVEERDYTVPANSRHTLSLNAELGPDMDVSCHITSDQPIICERPLYFNYTGRGAPGWSGGSAELGVTAPRTTWHFAEGYTGPGFHEWICLQNTGDAEAEVTVTYNIQGEGPRERAHRVPPGRYTICVNEDAGADLQLSASVTSDQPLICERSMYFSYGSGWSGGHCASGF